MSRRVAAGTKRAFDVIVAFCGMVLVSPLLFAIAAAIAVTSGFPILFRQRRIGLDGTIFVIRKFRTMRPAKPGEDWSRTDVERLTSLGRWLRKWSLDELPELYNVLRGDMSLVGPRPFVVEFYDRFSLDQMRRHEVRPGITGLAQVSGREDIPFSRRLELDVWYVDHQSFWLDLTILGRTVATVFAARGVDTVTVDMVDDLGLAADKSRFITGPDRGGAPLPDDSSKQRSG